MPDDIAARFNRDFRRRLGSETPEPEPERPVPTRPTDMNAEFQRAAGRVVVTEPEPGAPDDAA